MTRACEKILEWGGGEHLFALKGKQIEELQMVCKAPFGEIVQRVFLGKYYLSDLKHTIRLALIGGGMGPVEASRLVNFYHGDDNKFTPLADPNDPNNTETIAKAILQMVTFGIEELPAPPPGETVAGNQTDS